MSFLTTLLGSNPLETVKDLADEFIDTKAEKAERDIKLKQAFADIEINLEKSYNERLQMDVDDRNKARDMQIVALEQDDKFSKRFLMYFSAAWSFFTMVFMLLPFWVTIPEENRRLVDTMQGILLGTILVGIMTFWFGSSHGSREKDSKIQKLSGK